MTKNRRETKNALVQSYGWSMVPLINPKGRLVVDFDKKKFQLGDVVIFQGRDQLIAHRIIRSKIIRSQKLFLLKGDNNSRFDGWFNSQKILGRVEKIIYPDYVIDLTTRKNKILKYLFISYSYLNYCLPFFFNLHKLYKVPFFKRIYRFSLK